MKFNIGQNLNHRRLMIFTARVRSTREGNIYTWECLSVHYRWGEGVPCPRSGGVPHLRSGGYPIPGLGGTPSQVWTGGYPIPGLDGGGTTGAPLPWLDGVPPHHDWMGYPPPWQDWIPPSIASTCYAVGGMLLAFTQEDFLVWISK